MLMKECRQFSITLVFTAFLLHLIKFRPDFENTAKSLFLIAQRAAKTGMIGNCLLSFIPIKLMQISLILFYKYAPWISFRQDW